MTQTRDTSVLYNADCPVCRFEIDHYRSYAARKGLEIQFDDLNGPDLARWGLDADAAARRLYVLVDGELVSGVDAFLVLWKTMPRYRVLAVLIGLPVIRQIASFAYDKLAAPMLYRQHLRRQGRASK